MQIERLRSVANVVRFYTFVSGFGYFVYLKIMLVVLWIVYNTVSSVE
jgi:hypothetical protein